MSPPSRGSFPRPFGKYELLERIAVGGMAEIFLARSASLGGVTKTCVIKRILPEYSRDRQFVSMFIDEARITIGLNHENIVRLFDFGQVEGTYFMAMEFVDGRDLVDVLRLLKKEGKRFSPTAAAYVAAAVCRGLHHAHGLVDHKGEPLGVVHRDISPHNIFLDWSGAVKVGDFGIASARNKITVTQAGTVKGKFAYMAPEQTTGREVDARADVWAVGVVLWEVLASARLFAADNPVVTIGRVNEMPVPPLCERAPHVPPALDAVLARALERDVDKRYPTAEAMAVDLEAYLADAGGYGAAAFAAYLEGLDWAEDTATSPLVTKLPPSDEDRTPAVRSADHSLVDNDETIERLLRQLKRDPDLWTLAEMGERYLALEAEAMGVSALRVSAAIFAHRGLLVPALCAYESARARLSHGDITDDLMTFARLPREDRGALTAYLQRVDCGDFWPLLQAVDRQGLGDDDEGRMARHAPLFGRLEPAAFARLARASKVRRIGVGAVLVEEGAPGDALFAVGRGRLVVHCRPGTATDMIGEEAARLATAEGAAIGGSQTQGRIYLSALADGDFLGEFSFLTGRPRSASVEAITDCVVLELDRAATDEVARADPRFKEPLLEFYKERVGELMMAKNPVFALLASDDRRELLARSELRRYPDQSLVVEQGEVGEEMFFIKHGEVEVFQDDGGLPVFINKLREGEFFGEIAALRGVERQASVRAMGEVELFCMARSALADILASDERVRSLLTAAMTWREEEAAARVDESRRIFDEL